VIQTSYKKKESLLERLETSSRVYHPHQVTSKSIRVFQLGQLVASMEASAVKIWLNLDTISQVSLMLHMIHTPREIATSVRVAKTTRRRKNLRQLLLKRKKLRRRKRRRMILTLIQMLKAHHQMTVMRKMKKKRRKERKVRILRVQFKVFNKFQSQTGFLRVEQHRPSQSLKIYLI